MKFGVLYQLCWVVSLSNHASTQKSGTAPKSGLLVLGRQTGVEKNQ
jgi:hypothetical protein